MAERLVREKTINIFITAKCRWWVFRRKWIPNSNSDNLIIGLSHQSSAFWRMDLDSYFCFVGITKSEFATRGREKDFLLMHVFFAVFTLFAFTSLFFFSLLFPIQFSLFLALVVIPLPFIAIVPIYSELILCDFLLLPLLLTNHFRLLWTPSQSCPLPCWPFGLHYT